MKTPWLPLLAAAALGSAVIVRADTPAPAAPAAPAATAPDDSADTSAAAPTEKKKSHEGGGKNARAEKRVADISTKLGLTDDQKAKVKDILEQESDNARDIRKDDSLSEDAKLAKRNKLTASTQAQISALLTPDQQKKFDAIKNDVTAGGGKKKSEDK